MLYITDFEYKIKRFRNTSLQYYACAYNLNIRNLYSFRLSNETKIAKISFHKHFKCECGVFLFFFADDHPGLLKNLEPLTEYFDTIHNNRNYGYREHILLSIHWLNCSRQQYL